MLDCISKVAKTEQWSFVARSGYVRLYIVTMCHKFLNVCLRIQEKCTEVTSSDFLLNASLVTINNVFHLTKIDKKDFSIIEIDSRVLEKNALETPSLYLIWHLKTKISH